MSPALLVRLRPTGPWRFGPGDGGRDRLDTLYRSDRLFSAVTLAMQRLGALDEWLQATARTAGKPAVALSSLFPFQGDTLFAPPPATVWPPAAASVTSPSPVFLAKVRWRAATFVPLAVIEALLTGGSVLADQWSPDSESGCLLRRDRPQSSPFRITSRSGAAIDRVTHGAAEIHSSACVEFEAGAGLWTSAVFADAEAASVWKGLVQDAFRLLADSGFGARRTSGWGQTETPEFVEGNWPALLMPKLARFQSQNSTEAEGTLHWLLSVYSPAPTDTIDWAGGHYSLTLRGGRIESPAGSGAQKKQLRMIAEGSVLASATAPVGAAVDVAPEGFAHPVYRSGFALALTLPVLRPAPVVETAEPAGIAEPAPLADDVSAVVPVVEPQPEEAPAEPVLPEPALPEPVLPEPALPEPEVPEPALPPPLVEEAEDELELPLAAAPHEPEENREPKVEEPPAPESGDASPVEDPPHGGEAHSGIEEPPPEAGETPSSNEEPPGHEV